MRWIVLAASLVFASCRGSSPVEPEAPARNAAPAVVTPPPRSGPSVRIFRQSGAPVDVDVEVVREPRTRERGLMFRRDMDENHGMIFVFPRPDHQVFWMHNTILPLDMIFIRADRTILGIVKNATPETDDPREVPGDSLYVLEVNAGFSDRHHLSAGDRVELTQVPSASE
ncbi:MAG: DUF192 domain-containing protein [Deltaproteobacteria bacterium]|nr:DUF192 domain-containing protein [Myxococcales bacterium]MDP3218846.1 DUF192 domain-containing protein [Deltaproteobacteria bacterium]